MWLQLIRLCNAIHKRLGKHEVIPRARLLILIARCSTPFDRSGVNVQVCGDGCLGLLRRSCQKKQAAYCVRHSFVPHVSSMLTEWMSLHLLAVMGIQNKAGGPTVTQATELLQVSTSGYVC